MTPSLESNVEDDLKVIEKWDLDRTKSFQTIIDELIKTTDWNKFESMMIETADQDFVIQLLVVKQGDQRCIKL